MTWDEIGRDSLEAAKLLREAGRHRSSVSRAYYAAYAKVTGLVAPFADFPEDREGPSHEKLPTMASDYLTRLAFRERQRVESSLERLYVRRIEADYKMSFTVDDEMSLAALQEASRTFELLEKYYG